MKRLIILTTLLLSYSIHAEQNETSTEQQKSYKYPSELSTEEHNKMVRSRDYYDTCLKKVAQENMEKYEDVRKIADVAMEECKKTLSEIHKGLSDMDLDPDFIRFFLHKISHKSAQNLLPEIMMLKAQ